jgi:DNA mismatch repair ATPase MutL
LPLIFGDQQQHTLQEVEYSSAAMSVQGFITVPPASFGHKHKQYLYVNNRYVRAGEVGKLITRLFKAVMLRLEQANEHQQKRTNQVHPAFALQISCPASSYDITSDPDKAHIEFADWPAVLSAVQAAVLDAWHSVVGDTLLTELLDCPSGSAKTSLQAQPAATEAGRAELPVSCNHLPHTLPSPWTVPGCETQTHERTMPTSCLC